MGATPMSHALTGVKAARLSRVRMCCARAVSPCHASPHEAKPQAGIGKTSEARALRHDRHARHTGSIGGRKTNGGLPVSGRSHLAEALYPVDRPQQPSGIFPGATSAGASVHMLDQDR